MGDPGILSGTHHAAQVDEVSQHIFKPCAGTAVTDGALPELAHHAACIHSQGEPVAVDGEIGGAVVNLSAYHQPRDAAHSGVDIPGDAGDGAGDVEVFNGPSAEPKQAVAARIVLFDCHIADGMAAAVEHPRKEMPATADGDPLVQAAQVDVSGELYGQVRLAVVPPRVDILGKGQQVLCRADQQDSLLFWQRGSPPWKQNIGSVAFRFPSIIIIKWTRAHRNAFPEKTRYFCLFF